jgi:hypothetical protein
MSNLSSFLRSLADDIDNKQMNQEDIFRISEFYIEYVNKKDMDDISDKEFKKFLMMGWYIYKMLLKND